MRIQLLKRLRKEAYREYGILEIITDEGLQKYIVGNRMYIGDRKKWWGSFVVNDFLTDAIKVLTKYRHSYIQRRINQLRRKEQEKLLAYRNKEWKKL